MALKHFTPKEIGRAEVLVGRVKGIEACKISTDDTGRITEIHVVASIDKPAKLIARDVETCLKAEMDMDVDHRKIGVVMFDSPEPHPAIDVVEPAPVPEPAPDNPGPIAARLDEPVLAAPRSD